MMGAARPAPRGPAVYNPQTPMTRVVSAPTIASGLVQGGPAAYEPFYC